MPTAVGAESGSPMNPTASAVANSGRAERTALEMLAPTRWFPAKMAMRPRAVPTAPAPSVRSTSYSTEVRQSWRVTVLYRGPSIVAGLPCSTVERGGSVRCDTVPVAWAGARTRSTRRASHVLRAQPAIRDAGQRRRAPERSRTRASSGLRAVRWFRLASSWVFGASTGNPCIRVSSG